MPSSNWNSIDWRLFIFDLGISRTLLSMATVIKEVSDLALVLALDYLYRETFKVFEVEKLLPASRVLVAKLQVPISQVAIEGYYNESAELTEYFLNIRALQQVEGEKKSVVEQLDEYQLLFRVVSAEIFGSESETNKLLPAKKDPLYFALAETNVGEWDVKTLTEKAHEFAVKNDDISLVGIAAYLKDSVVLAALRESVVLYAMVMVGCAAGFEPPTIKYVWNVSPELATKVNRFIDIFNHLTSSQLKQASAENVEYFYQAYDDNNIEGRCVRIGFDDSQSPAQNYHWAVKRGMAGLEVDEFWHQDLWTTQRYQSERLYSF